MPLGSCSMAKNSMGWRLAVGPIMLEAPPKVRRVMAGKSAVITKFGRLDSCVASEALGRKTLPTIHAGLIAITSAATQAIQKSERITITARVAAWS